MEAERENQKNFNPRSREGSDDYCYKRGDVTQISIHAPAKGATRGIGCVGNYTKYFNPRSREGSDSQMAQDVGQIQISIHAPAKGATDNSDITISRLIFQSTLPRRERPASNCSGTRT